MDVFHVAEQDVRDAAWCFAFGQSTATVFHSMRILEIGLWWLAARMGVKKATTKEWARLIDEIQSRVGKTLVSASGPRQKARAHFYAEAAAELRYFKDAWRNYVAHAKESYDDATAEVVLWHVKTFMNHLATGKRRS
jgi:hypothetical protein